MRYRACSILVASIVVLSAMATSGRQPRPSALSDIGSRVLDVEGGKVRVVTVAKGLFHPWSLAFIDARTILVAERNGKMRMIRDGVLSTDIVWTSPTPTGAPGEMHYSVAVHPRFLENRLVYIAYPKRGERGSTLAVARGRLVNSKLEEAQEIFVADAWEPNGGNMAGRLLFGPDASLYITVGDRDARWSTNDNRLRMRAQDLRNHYGKTLRIRDDGGVPPDNPFVGRSDAKPEIFTYGHRNGYGLAWHPQTGELWQAEIGPMGGDEVNILQPGHNYGWPLVSTGRNYTDTPVSDQPWARPGMDNPRLHWVPSVSPSNIMFYTGEKFAQWRNNLFVGTLTARQLIRIKPSFALDKPGLPEGQPYERLLVELGSRLRDVQQSPDGFIYVATEQSFPDTANADTDGMVLRIEPADR